MFETNLQNQLHLIVRYLCADKARIRKPLDQEQDLFLLHQCLISKYLLMSFSQTKLLENDWGADWVDRMEYGPRKGLSPIKERIADHVNDMMGTVHFKQIFEDLFLRFQKQWVPVQSLKSQWVGFVLRTEIPIFHVRQVQDFPCFEAIPHRNHLEGVPVLANIEDANAYTLQIVKMLICN